MLDGASCSEAIYLHTLLLARDGVPARLSNWRSPGPAGLGPGLLASDSRTLTRHMLANLLCSAYAAENKRADEEANLLPLQGHAPHQWRLAARLSRKQRVRPRYRQGLIWHSTQRLGCPSRPPSRFTATRGWSGPPLPGLASAPDFEMREPDGLNQLHTHIHTQPGSHPVPSFQMLAGDQALHWVWTGAGRFGRKVPATGDPSGHFAAGEGFAETRTTGPSPGLNCFSMRLSSKRRNEWGLILPATEGKLSELQDLLVLQGLVQEAGPAELPMHQPSPALSETLWGRSRRRSLPWPLLPFDRWESRANLTPHPGTQSLPAGWL